PLVAVYSGTFLVATKRLSDWPKRTGSGVPGLSLGAAVAFVDIWGGVVVAAALLAGLGALLLLRKPHGGTNDIPDRRAPSGRLPDGADRSWRSEIAAKRYGMARPPGRLGRPARRSRPLADRGGEFPPPGPRALPPPAPCVHRSGHQGPGQHVGRALWHRCLRAGPGAAVRLLARAAGG